MKAVIFILLVQCGTLFASQSDDVANYNGYKVWSVTPKDAEQKVNLYLMKPKYNLDFWDDIAVGNSGRIMVAPEYQKEFQELINSLEIENRVIIENAQTVVEKELRQFTSTRDDSNNGPFSHYWSYEEMNDYMTEIANTHFYFIERFTVANSTEGRPIYGVKFSMTGRVTGARPIMFVDGGIHAREWIAPMQVICLMHVLVNETFQNLDIAEMNDFILVPLINVDGYIYTQTDRLWRKTRSLNENSDCIGTDGNRNYDMQWNPGPDPCSVTFGGSHPFSEPEIAGIRDIMLQYQDSIKCYVSVHSYGNYLLYGWGFRHNHPVDNWVLHHLIGGNFTEAVRAVRGERYRVGTIADMLYIAEGTSTDYTVDLGIPLSYVIELPGGGDYGFDLPAENITDVVLEILQGFNVLGLYMTNEYNGILPTKN